jgi:hydroxyacylglutathione hydrolase
MLVRRFYDDRLAQASYLIGCQQQGEAIVIDPPRDIAALVAAAEAEGMTITRVTETHIHADFVSGARELAAATGATLLLSAEGGAEWQYRSAAADGATLLRHGDLIRVGNIRLVVRHTPGHTPEHIVFIVTDGARSDEPVAMVSGDFIFVGDVGRPDLLERAAHQAGTMDSAARQLYHSLQATVDLPDHLQVWPGHGAGSACGKALGAMPTSTLGYERRTNWAFGAGDEEAFVQAVLDGQPSPPSYFARMKQVNRDGPPVLGPVPSLEQIRLADAAATLIIDVRPGRAFAAGHLPRSISLPLTSSFTTWAGWLLPADQPLALLAGSVAAAEAARRALSSIGLDRVVGWIDAGELDGRNDLAVAHHGDITQAGALIAAARRVIDLRERHEWSAGHIPGAEHQPLGTLAPAVADLPRDTPLAIHCQGGGRSGIGASVLERMGFTDVLDLTGGYRGWSEK